MTTKEDFICPKCKTKNRIKIKDSISSDQMDKIITREFFMQECKKCHEKISVEYPIKIEDEKYVIYYTPGKTDEIEDNSKEINRICDTFDDLKEKLLILNDDLNDITVEFIKEYIKNNLDKELIKNLNIIRYEGSDEENLYFRLLGVEQSAKCLRSVYEEINNRMKFKKIKNCVLIDQYTFSSYCKLK